MVGQSNREDVQVVIARAPNPKLLSCVFNSEVKAFDAIMRSATSNIISFCILPVKKVGESYVHAALLRTLRFIPMSKDSLPVPFVYKYKKNQDLYNKLCVMIHIIEKNGKLSVEPLAIPIFAHE